MGLRDRIMNRIKRVVGGGGSTPASTSTSAAAAASSTDGFLALAASAALVEGTAKTGLAPNGRTVALFRHQGKLYCVDNECRHEDGPVGEGEIKGTVVKCPYHDWAYDFTTGQCVSNPENKLETYHIKEQGGQIWVGAVATPGTSMRGGEHNDGMKVIVK